MYTAMAQVETAQLDADHDASFPAEFPARWACDWGVDKYGLWMAFRYRGVRRKLRWIRPGEFMMGSPESEAERLEDEIKRTVRRTCEDEISKKPEVTVVISRLG